MKIRKKIQASEDIRLTGKYVYRIWQGKLRIGEIIYRDKNADVPQCANVAVTWDDGSSTTTTANLLRYIEPSANMDMIREVQGFFNELGMDISNEVKLFDYYLEQTGDVDKADKLSDEAAHYGRQLTTQQWVNVKAATASRAVQYGEFIIALDIGGDGYNILKDGQIWDEGYASVQKAMKAIDESGEKEDITAAITPRDVKVRITTRKGHLLEEVVIHDALYNEATGFCQKAEEYISEKYPAGMTKHTVEYVQSAMQYAPGSDNWTARDNSEFFNKQNTEGESHPDVGKAARVIKKGDELYGKKYPIVKVADDVYTLRLGETTTATYRRSDLTLHTSSITSASRPAGPYIVWVKIKGQSEWRMFKSSQHATVDDDFLARVSANNKEDYSDVIVLPQGQDPNVDDDALPTSKQEFTSEKTSINSSKLPAIYKMIHIPAGSVVIDYGGGKFDNAVDYMAQQDVTLHVYDPYNRSDEHNREVIRAIRKNGGADYAICSNVLNVIKEASIRKEVLENIKRLLKSNGKLYLTVYEGKGDGAEGETKSGYQLNRPTAGYLEEIQEVFPDAVRKGKLITATPAVGSVKSSTDISASNAENKQAALLQKITDKVLEYMQGPEGGFELEDAKYYSKVEGRMENGAFVVEVRCECGYDFMMNLADELNHIIQEVDHDAYFDMEQPGIMTAYLYHEAITSATRLKRIAKLNEFDNGFVFHSWAEMSEEEAETLAKQMSIKNPNQVYYVAYDDVMNPASELRWVNGKSYSDMEVLFREGRPHLKVGDTYQPITSAQNWRDIPERSLEPPEYPDNRYDMEDTLEFAFDLTITVDDTGYYEYSEESKKDFVGEGRDGAWMGDEYFGYLVCDPNTLEEQLDELITHMIPEKAGTYKIKGVAHLVYDIEGVEPETDDEVFFNSGEVSFNFAKSSVDSFKWEPVKSGVKSAEQVRRTRKVDLDNGYYYAEYSNGAKQITKSRPYDDADYYYALLKNRKWLICKAGKIFKTIDEAEFDQLDEIEFMNELVDELEMVNSVIKPKMMHN